MFISDIRQEDGTLRWLLTSTQREMVSTSSILQKSVGKVDEAYNAVADIVAEGGTILFVGTKKQAQDAIKSRSRALWNVLCKREMA